MSARRFDRLPHHRIGGREVPVAVGFRARLLGLSCLDRSAAGTGLLIPRCAAVHTVGMRFELDLLFLDGGGVLVAERRRVGPGRFVRCAGAAAVLELPAAGGESGRADA